MLTLGATTIEVLPAHFLHCVGNLQPYDPTRRILFSGDLGAVVNSVRLTSTPGADFDTHLPFILSFHMRDRGGEHDPGAIVPQHSAPLTGKKMVGKFLDWIESLACGVDLMPQDKFAPPSTGSQEMDIRLRRIHFNYMGCSLKLFYG